MNYHTPSVAFIADALSTPLQAPCLKGELTLDIILNVVGQVAEEVDAGKLFKLVYGDYVVGQRLVVVPLGGLLFGPEADGAVAYAVLHETSHEEILRNDETALDTGRSPTDEFYNRK